MFAFRQICFLGAALVLLIPLAAFAQTANPNVQITVSDAQKQAITGAVCSLIENGKIVFKGQTDTAGMLIIPNVAAGIYTLTVESRNFETYQNTNFAVAAETPIKVEVTLNVGTVSAEVTVENSAVNPNSIEAGSSPPAGDLARRTIERLPLATRRVDEAIPLVPGVIRSSTGEISIEGATEQQSAFQVNGLNVADPASGNFRLNLPIDAVESVQVFRHPFSAEFGQFTGGVTDIQTRRGGDQLHFEINDFLPDFRFVNGKIVGVQDDSPRINFNGPLIKDKLFFAQSLGYGISKVPVRGLRFPVNETISESENSFTQLDWIISQKHSQTFTFGYFPERQQFIGLDFFRPQPVTPNYKQQDFVATLRDNYALGGGLLSSSVSMKRFNANVWGQGTNDQNLTPTGESGNYFATQERRSFRAEFFEIYELPARRLFYGNHNIKVGFNFTSVGNRMNFAARPVNVFRADGSRAERVVFGDSTPIKVTNRTYTGFVQDRWILRPNFSFDVGARFENQNIASERNFSPRIGFSWSPLKGDKTIVRGGIGYFYDKVPLNVRGFAQYPARTITRFAADGTTVTTQRTFENILVDSPRFFPLDFTTVKTEVGFVPENLTWNVQIDQIINERLSLRANYTNSRTQKIYVVTPEVDLAGRRAIVLSPTGAATYKSFELTAKFALPMNQQFYTSYVRSKARGDLNDFNTYFGNFGNPLIRRNQISNLPTDVPQRFLTWGSFTLPKKITVAPIIEVRNGFPYSVISETQNFVGTRNADKQRFPTFFAVDAEVSKDFQVTKKYGIRLSVRGFNLTNHFNPRDVRNNLGDAHYGQFLNNYRRYFTGGFDIIF